MSDWQYEKLSDLTKKVGSGSTPRGGKHAYKDQGIPLIRSMNVHFDGFKYDGLAYIDDAQAEKLKAAEVNADDVLLNITGASIGRVTIAPKHVHGARVNQHVCIIRTNEVLSPKFLSWFLASPAQQDLIMDVQSGVTRQALTKSKILDFTVPLPPPEQQKRIVAKIEELFSHIDAGIAALNKAKQLLKQYRQSVLKAAVTGELTKQWREENKDKLEPASQLLERILQERRQKWEAQQLELFKAKGKVPKNDNWKGKYQTPSVEGCKVDVVDESWLKVDMGILKFYSIYGPRFSSDDYSDDGVVVLRTTDMDERGKVKIENAPKLDLSESDYDKYRVDQGDLLITRTGSIGTLAIFKDDCRAIPGAYLLHYKFIQGSVNPGYIYLVFKSPEIQKTLTGSTQGIGRPNLNAPTLEAIPFNLPCLSEQQEILNITNEKIEAMNRLENEMDSKIKMAEKNKQSILASAFSGKI